MAKLLQVFANSPCLGLGSEWRTLSRVDGAQLVELAVTLPLLVVLFLGIYDFGQALTLKQKLAVAAREGARFAANQTTLDLSNTSAPPTSIIATRDVIDAYLVTNGVNDCGLATQAPSAPTQWTWTFTTGTCGGGPLVVSVNRGFTFPSGNGVTVEATEVQITYPYKWQFGSALGLLAPGANYTVTNVGADAVMPNLN